MNFVKGAIAIATGVITIVISQFVLAQNADAAYLNLHTGIHPGVATSAILFLVAGYFLALGFVKKSKRKGVWHSRVWWLALHEFSSRPFRNLTMSAGIGVVVGIIFLSLIITSGATTSVNLASGKAGADIMVVSEGTIVENDFYFYPFSYSSKLRASVSERITSIDGVESVSRQLFLATVLTEASAKSVYETYFVAVEPDDPFVTPWLDGKNLGEDELVGGSDIFNSTLRVWKFNAWELKKRASLPVTGTYVDRIVYVTPETAKELIYNSTEVAGFVAPPGYMSYQKGLFTTVYVKVSEDASVNAVAESISEKVGQVKVIKTNQLASTVSQRLQNLLSAFLFLGGLIIGTTVILISSVSSLTVNENRRNIGVLRAVGASKLFVSKLLASQIILLSLFGGAAGIGSAALVFYLNFQTIIRSLRIPFVPLPFFDFVGVIFVSLLIAVASGVAASLYPAYKANKIDPFESISRDPR